MNLHGTLPIWLTDLGDAYLRAGRIDDAERNAVRALESARALEECGHEAWALTVLGEVVSQRHPANVAVAEQHYAEAMALADARGMRPLVAHCHLGLGKLCRRVYNDGQAEEHLTIAAAMYREMKMTYWLEQTASEMRQIQ